MQIDETKLKAAIAEDPTGVYKLFMNDGDATNDNRELLDRLRANLKSAMTDISTKAGKTSSVNNTFTLGSLLNNYNDQITSLKRTNCT